MRQLIVYILCLVFFFQAEDGIRDLVRSRGLGDVYKRQDQGGGDIAKVAVVHSRLDVRILFFHGVHGIVDDLSLIHI